MWPLLVMETQPKKEKSMKKSKPQFHLITKTDLINSRTGILKDLADLLMGIDEQIPGTMKRVRAIVGDRFKTLAAMVPTSMDPWGLHGPQRAWTPGLESTRRRKP